jgi:hypothetical protein
VISFKEYFLCEVKASKANIALFKKKYSNDAVYDSEMGRSEGEYGTDEDEFVEGIIDYFNDQVKRGTMKQKDIFGFKSYSDLLDELNKASVMKSGSELKRIEKEQATRVFENDKVLVIHPKSHEASCHYGAGSKWCTASKNEPSHFGEYTNKQGIVLLYFLPKKGFETPAFKIKEVKDDDATIDHLLLNYPQAFDWSYDSSSKSITKYILAAYLNGRPSEPLSIIAGWSPENAIAVNQARENMKRVVQAWNTVGGKILLDVLGPIEGGAGDDFSSTEDYLGHLAMSQGLIAFIQMIWDGDTPGSSATQPVKEYWRFIEAVMEQLKQGSDPLSLGRDPAFEAGRDTRWDKAAIAVSAIGDEHDHGGGPELSDRVFGQYPAEAFLADDSEIEPRAILNAFDISKQDINKMSEYVGQFATDKIWGDKDPNKIFTYLERKENQTPENIKKADEFFLNEPNAAFSRGAWNYGSDIRGNALAGRGKMDSYLDQLGDKRAKTKKPWKELEDAFIKAIDEAQKEGERLKGLMIKKQTWDGNQEIQKTMDDEHRKGQPAGATLGHPEDAATVVSRDFKDWLENTRRPIDNFLGTAQGLLGYLYKVKRYNWPELEKRVLDPRYHSVGITKLGPDWVQHGRGGDRWDEFEETLFEIWKDKTANPYKNQKDVDTAQGMAGREVPYVDSMRAKTNIADHMNLYGSVEDIVQLVKATKRSYGGGTGGSERAAWEEAKDAWWNNPEVVALYWGGEGVITKKQKPSEKKRGKPATTLFVNKNNYVKRPFYHNVKPGAWLQGIPNIFTLSNSHVDAQYVGQYNPGEPDSYLQ